MHTYRVCFEDDSVITVNARSRAEALQIAQAMYPHTRTLTAERVD